MRRAERLFRLVNELRNRGVSRAEDLAAHFEISVRTVYRDVAHLQASGLPIEGEAGVGYLLRPGFDLPALTFTYEQLDALAMGLSFVEVAGDASLSEAAREVRGKLQASLPAPDKRKLENAPLFASRRDGRAPPLLKVVRRAVREARVLRLRYGDAEGQPSERRVRPLAVWAFTDGWLFAGWCELRNDFRAFRLDRVSAIEETDVHFADIPTQNLQAYLAAKIFNPEYKR
ncbi:YafY family protein [Sphingomonas sp. GV3]|jgi:predicted DNA-binding transcriptional regulator YafY|uniref:helix-turn-helix transcriptional regulator n=1 Tax=Sphingomonas sp. GV3 TaxID=3040671 RepID=UPI00280AE113|nr:YafY family protein [Sphingomonas sp. GV3]